MAYRNKRGRPKSTFKWKRMLIKELIVTYEQFELLYNSKHKHYQNVRIKKEALKKIREKLIQKGSSGVLTLFDIKSKIRHLRTQFAKEMRAVTNSDTFYQPKLWCFDQLVFLKPYLIMKKDLTIKKLPTISQESRLVELVGDYYAMLFIPADSISEEHKNEKWEEISSELNIMGPPQSPEQWISIFKNLRYHTRRKLAKLRKYHQGKDFYGIPLSITLTNQDKQICEMMGESDIGQLERSDNKQQNLSFSTSPQSSPHTTMAVKVEVMTDPNEDDSMQAFSIPEANSTLNWNKGDISKRQNRMNTTQHLHKPNIIQEFQQETVYLENVPTILNPLEERALTRWIEVTVNGASTFPIDTEPVYQSEPTKPKVLQNYDDRNTDHLIKIKEAKLKFDVAKFKFLHPDFQFDDAILELSDSE